MEAKLAFEYLAQSNGVVLKSYRADNGCFVDNEFKDNCEALHQELTFCGVDAHHQNNFAKCHIRLLTDTACTVLLHATNLWRKVITHSFWSFALKYAADQHNQSSLDSNGYMPQERFTRMRATISPELFHTFVCPVFVLDARNQSGLTSIPK